MFLLNEFEDKFRYGRYVLHLDMSFDNILLFMKMLEDDELSDEDKCLIGLEMLVKDYKKIEDISFQEKIDLFKYIMKEFLDTDIDAPPEEGGPTKKDFDFEVDAERIYASFLMDYNIDLFEQRGKLHWKKFLALLSGLSEKTPFMQVVRIRNMEVPKPTKYNAKERQQIQKLKRKYALEDQDINSALDQAATFLRGKAKVGDKNG